MVVSFLTSKKRPTVEKNWLTHCSPVSFNEYFWIPYKSIQFSRKVVARFLDVIFTLGIALVSFSYRLVTITTCWLLDVVPGNGPNMSIATNFSG